MLFRQLLWRAFAVMEPTEATSRVIRVAAMAMLTKSSSNDSPCRRVESRGRESVRLIFINFHGGQARGGSSSEFFGERQLVPTSRYALSLRTPAEVKKENQRESKHNADNCGWLWNSVELKAIKNAVLGSIVLGLKGDGN